MLTTYTYSVSIERMRWKRGEEMKVSKKDIRWAVSEGVISEGQAEDLWLALQRRDVDRPRFDLPHVAYYFGALVVISAMTWFMTLGWERFGGGGMLLISLSYALAFTVAGGLLWRDKGLKVPGGLLITAAVCMTPLAVYGFETMTGAWLQGAPGAYGDFYDYIKGGWFPLEIATVAAGLVALWFFGSLSSPRPSPSRCGSCPWTSHRSSTASITTWRRAIRSYPSFSGSLFWSVLT
jgi:hypothetical protein